MAEPDDLTSIMARAGEVFTMFCALQEAGFERAEAMALMPYMLMTIRRHPES